ncbi:MAG: hypothetical protein A2268_09900 [Candidatus Raymondbacteria bacterium RifOxyA12_full_50_37]|uniref:Uncharacterized protein n=1 Tax=Candidatus Raymondbacteria bacterium RIFOXYD12_FULL_49_13 TaxID=1817890 RepID=A0A1F7F413_UNCRA|nr:MAG: hypothetical protein A2268_09900 [Candidatus Raymondbacteria bacterium RifOxyA12_full_50_37]OGJ93850.1 MAG: hypothetical protein A2248_06400 [Candidatus Raymondbacteria bacterium RIFOXYA2_FULL_49_16]OGJ98282.1 MAG: hypothetical protein A2453_00770 [Candidatus Raymondbacteria bacterium RIFOXYC2_FULL_50_21]OGK01415.1 MAG: hypothetical protein A2519_15005 [Candidatus Raymondbacteria bacterium RIFOXYD12_FULL_49_13]OGP45355.1 MAG: hypothetical protein A2324_22165 [Candidatus Raymondbacteria 
MLLQLLFIPLFLFSSRVFANEQDAMTAFIVKEALVFSRNNLPGTLPDSMVLVKTGGRKGMVKDTLCIPQDIWGFKTTNNYSLHFYTVFVIAFNTLFQLVEGERTARDFFFCAGKASDFALKYLNTFEKDRMVNDLLMYNYVYQPYMTACRQIIISRDFKDSSRTYCCMLKSALAYRCDTSMVDEWISTTKYVDYGITRVAQKPIGWKKYEITVALRNFGSMAVPFEVLLDFDGGDTLLKVASFTGDTALTIRMNQSLLKVLLDPKKRLFDVKEDNQQYISWEFTSKRRVYKTLTLLLWDALASLSAFVLLLFLGIFIHPLTEVFYKRNPLWTGIYIFLFTGIKLSLPYMLYGFNMWGFVYIMHLIYYSANMVWIGGAGAGVFFLIYFLLKKDGVRFIRLETYMKYIAVSVFLNPIVGSFGF